MHHRRVDRWGSPHGRAIKKLELQPYREQVSEILNRDPKHPGVVSAKQFITSWLEAAASGADVPGRRDVARLHAHGITADAVLNEAAAVFALSYFSPRTLPDDERLTFMLGAHVIGLAPREQGIGYLGGKRRVFYRPIGKVAREAVGKRLRLNLLKLFLNVALTVERDRAAREQRDQDFIAPFPKAKE